MMGTIRFSKQLLRPRIFLALVTIIFAVTSAITIRHNVTDLKDRALLFSGDTHHYLDIAKDFAAGNFSMDYVADRPHRQPLYPLLVSPIFRWGNGDAALLASMSAIVIFATFLLAYWQILRRFRSRFAAALIGSLFLLYPFIREQTTDRLLSEPLHLLLMVAVIFAALDWMENRRFRSLLLAFAFCGLDYLDRANGLFVTASLIGALGLHEICRPLKSIFADRGGALLHLVMRYAAALAVFVIVSAPSWLPRVKYFHDPIHHGYLSNYMWVDSYREGHVGQKYATFTAHDYLATHGAKDVAIRWAKGIWNCWFAIPFGGERRMPILFFLTVIGLGVTAWRGPRSCRILAIFGVVQMLPLIWTNMSNPSVRLPLAAILPFFLFFAAYGLTQILEVLRTNKKTQRFMPAPNPAP